MKKLSFPLLAIITWLLVVATLELVILFSRGKASFEYKLYANIRTGLGFPFIISAIASLFWVWKGNNIFVRKSKHLALSDWATALVIFWTLFPPIWFFTEYMAVEFGVFNGAPTKDIIKDYGDLASKVWAAFLALYIAILAQRYDAAKKG